jgi:hypothetical protein
MGSRRCECGKWRIDGKCPICDAAALNKPYMRRHRVEKKIRERGSRERENGQWLSVEESRSGAFKAMRRMKH